MFETALQSFRQFCFKSAQLPVDMHIVFKDIAQNAGLCCSKYFVWVKILSATGNLNVQSVDQLLLKTSLLNNVLHHM
jgi:hypothetical protein